MKTFFVIRFSDFRVVSFLTILCCTKLVDIRTFRERLVGYRTEQSFAYNIRVLQSFTQNRRRVSATRITMLTKNFRYLNNTSQDGKGCFIFRSFISLREILDCYLVQSPKTKFFIKNTKQLALQAKVLAVSIARFLLVYVFCSLKKNDPTWFLLIRRVLLQNHVLQRVEYNYVL